ncbi:hypothetical protein [Mycobacterium asiaticum]|uniref:hypothetical protein n=1 Tax=Mycobacterium asiaticum TaxID=1790 RepID=UPI0007EF0A42|nr:hypothetical protein [Mycobacterium asiaticum]OBI98395.1 hypothetical protein A5661_15755 [Mycobacterium asiaticum]
MAPLDEPLRTDETQKRLLDWTYQQPPSERLAAQILDPEGYEEIDPSHPLGGKDGGRDGTCSRNGENGVWAVYFPRHQQTLKAIKDKLKEDIEAARKHDPKFLVFVTNQEIRMAERDDLRKLGGDIRIDLFHLERVAGILDRPHMAGVREQFLRIPAAALPPMNVLVSVDGAAHAFIDDDLVLAAFVGLEEDQIRKRSDEGHERVRSEHEARLREERAKRAREAAERAQAARERPWDVAAQVRPISEIFGPNSPIFDRLLNVPRFEMPRIGLPGLEPPKPPEPLSEDQIQDRVAQYRAGLEARWPACRDYLAGMAWSALRLRIWNAAESFLNDVQVIVTFHGARGVRSLDLAEYEFMKVQDPSWEPPSHPLYSPAQMPVPRMRKPDGYPIEWRHNDDGDLVVTVTLPQLRPHPEWRSEHHGEDIVLVVDPEDAGDEITVTYTATAYPYGKPFVGDPFTIPVEKAAMRDVLRTVQDAADGAS